MYIIIHELNYSQICKNTFITCAKIKLHLDNAKQIKIIDFIS